MRNGSMLIAIVSCGIAFRLLAQESQGRASIVPADEAANGGIQVKVFPIRKGDATALAEMLGTLLGQGSSGVRPLRIVPDARTNSILAVGAAGDLEVIRAVLARLENPSSYRLQPMLQPAPKTAAAAVPIGSDKANALKGMQSLNVKPVRQDMNDAKVRLESTKTELERQEALRNRRSPDFSSSELARARLAVRSAEIRLEQIPKPPGDRWKTGLKP